MTDPTRKLAAIIEHAGTHHTVTGQCADCGKAIQRITDDYPSAIAAKLAMSRGLMRCDPCTTRARIGL